MVKNVSCRKLHITYKSKQVPVLIHIIKMLLSVVTVLVVCINRIVVADDQCVSYEFDSPFFPGISCEDIYNKNPQTHNKPGYYWILDGPKYVYCGINYTGLSCEDIYHNNRETGNKNGYYPINNNQWTFCDMTAIAADYFTFTCAGVGGEWRRIASVDISAGDECPTGWNKSSHSNISFCRSPSDNAGCYSTNFSANGMSYTRVCGKARGYQKGSTDPFVRYNDADPNNINGPYVDGLSITHGTPRQHIWTYVVGLTDHGHIESCPCSPNSEVNPPSFLGSNYYCESGTGNSFYHETYYFSDPLWDGSGCSSGNTCCSNNNLPWFQYQLSEMTQDDIEVRICTDEEFFNEGVLIDIIELFIQ